MIRQFFRIALLVVLSAFLPSCGIDSLLNKYPGAEITKTEAGNTLIVTDNFTAVILPADFMEKHDPFIQPPGYWTPDVNQILYIESKIGDSLSEHPTIFNSDRAPDKETLSTYIRQYHGVVTENGTQYIRGLFFCLHYQDGFDWKNKLLTVLGGGGDCLIYVTYNPESGELFAGAGSMK